MMVLQYQHLERVYESSLKSIIRTLKQEPVNLALLKDELVYLLHLMDRLQEERANLLDHNRGITRLILKWIITSDLTKFRQEVSTRLDHISQA